MSLTREQLLQKVKIGLPSSLAITDPVARQCFEALREVVLLIAMNDDATEAVAPVVYGAEASIVKSGKNRFALLNDEDTPGSNKVYGTNGDGEKVWKDDPDLTNVGSMTELPSGLMSIVLSSGHYKLDGDEESPGNNKFYGTSATGEKGFQDIPVQLTPRYSIVKDTSGNLNLSGETGTIANNTSYGKSSAGAMGFHANNGLPAGAAAYKVLICNSSGTPQWGESVVINF